MPIAINTDSISIGNYIITLTIAHSDE
jgi:hypothetical protein